jgi:hypothetical protein
MATKLTTMLLLTLTATALVAPITSPVLAQSSTNDSVENSSATSTPNPTPENETAVARVDKLTVVTDYRLSNGTLYVELYSAGGNKLTVTETTQEDGVTQVALTEEWIPRGRYRLTVDLVNPSEPSVLITTRHSLRNDRGTEISPDTGSDLIPDGPYTGSDARDVGLGSAGGVAIAHLWVAVRAKLGSSDKAERVA